MDLAFFTHTPAGLAVCYYGGLSLLTVMLYGWDKWAAQTGRSRISERTLHTWTLLGGFLGAIVGQVLFRHKTRKLAFVLGAWGALTAHVVAWVLALTR